MAVEPQPEPELLPDVKPPAKGDEPAPIQPIDAPKGLDILPPGPPLPDRPNRLHFTTDSADTVPTYDTRTGDANVPGPLKVVTDNGVTITALSGRQEGASGKFFLDGAVKVVTEDHSTEIFANHAVADPNASTITLTGNVSIFRGNLLQRGESTVYYWKEKKMDSSNLRAGVDPLLLEAGRFTVEERDGKQVYVGHQAGVTTHDVEDPAFWLRSDETTVYPDDKVTFRNLKVYAGDTPIFWLPYLSQPLDADLGYHFVPGARTNWGAYLLNSYGIMLGEGAGEGEKSKEPWLLSRWHFDLRSRRGIGTGVELLDTRLKENPNLKGLSFYYTNDLDPDLSRNGLPRRDVNEDRWRLALQHQIPFDWESNADWRLDANLNYLSDRYYLEDFEPQLLRSDPAPDNTIGLFRRDDASLFSIYTRLRLNEFYRSDSRLPEIAFDMARRPIFGTPIQHEGTTSLSFIREEIGSEASDIARNILELPAGDPSIPTLLSRLPAYERQLVDTIRSLPPGSPQLAGLRTQLMEPAYTRFNTYQELTLPIDLGGWFHLTPELGVGYTRYDNVEGPAGSFDRFSFHAGAEASVKFSKDYGPFVNRSLGLDGLLHVFQPYARYSFVSTDDIDPDFGGVDRSTFTTRPPTLAVPRYTAIDSLRDWNVLRMGMRNRLITRRDGQSFEWLRMDTYIDRFFTDPDYDRNFSNLYNDVLWSPLPWFKMELETQFPVTSSKSSFSEVAATAHFMPTPNFEFSVGHRVLQDHPVLLDSNRVDVRAYLRLTEQWGIGALQEWEFDDGTLEVQQYTLHRDFNHWIASVGLTQRDNRLKKEYGVVFSITLKEFPSVSVPLKMDAE